jgi:UPF0716 family protein affecting phage T7 exclusion
MSDSNRDENPIDEEPFPAVARQRAYGLRRQFHALCAMRPHQITSLLSRAYADWSSDGATRLGAALAYFTLFSVAPVLIVVTGVAGLFIGQAAARGQVAPWLERLLSPQGAQAAELMLKQVATPAGGVIATIGGLVTLFLATSFLVTQLRQSLNVVWRVQEPPTQEMGIIASVCAMAVHRGKRQRAFNPSRGMTAAAWTDSASGVPRTDGHSRLRRRSAAFAEGAFQGAAILEKPVSERRNHGRSYTFRVLRSFRIHKSLIVNGEMSEW